MKFVDNSWRKHVDVLLPSEKIQERVQELGREITRDFAGQKVTMVGILKGCFVFFADLVRAVDLEVRTEFIGISSYGDDTVSSGVVQITSDLTATIHDENVIIVEDIVDTGLTMAYLLDNFSTRKPAALKVCTLLHKPSNQRVEVPVDYTGFTIPDKFVVGYGLDYASYYRNLPFIGVYSGPT